MSNERIWLAGLDLLEQRVAVLNADGVLVKCNSAWRRYGEAAAAADPNWEVGGHLVEFFSSDRYRPVARSSIAAALHRALDSSTSFQSATYSSGQDTAQGWFKLSFRQYAVEGRAYALVTHEDMTASRNLEVTRRRELAEVSLQAVVAAHINRAIVVLDTKGTIEWVNSEFVLLHGYASPGDVLGQSLSSLHGLTSDAATRVLMERRIRAGVGVDIEASLHRIDGRSLWIRTEIRPVRAASGSLEHFVAIQLDITERKQAADKLAQERELLNTIVNGVPHLIFWADRDLILRGCNRQYALVAGLASPEHIVGRTVAQLPLMAQHAERYNGIDRHIIETGLPALRMRETDRLANGEQRVILMNRMPLRLSDNSVGGILVISEDITEEERDAQKMREDEERWTLALEVNDVAVWDFDAIARSVVGSRRWLELVGPSASESSDTPLGLGLVHADDLPRFIASWEALLLGLLPALESGIRLKIDDTYRYMRLRGRVVRRDCTGKALRIVGTIVDIHEAMLKQMQTANARKLESIGQLAAGIAHEINTPTQYVGDNVRFLGDAFASIQKCFDGLNALTAKHDDSVSSKDIQMQLGGADLAYLQEEIPKAVAQSLDGINRVAQIVSAMKEFSHPSQELTPTDINRAIANTITVATNEWKYVATVVTEFDSSLPAVPVIPGEFNQVILNLIVNAAHAIGDTLEAGSTRKGRIRILTRHTAEWAEIFIADDGCGMPAHIQERIFDPFFTTKPVGKGTGQGLSIAHNVIVTKHRGTISVSSDPGRGTTFIVRVPLKVHALVENAA